MISPLAPAPLSPKRRIAYASGNLGKSVQWNTIEFVYLYFLIDTVGVTPAQAGLVIVIPLIWDGLCAPVIGFLVDRLLPARLGYGGLLAIAAPLSAAAFILLFGVPLAAPDAVWLALAVGLLFRTAYSLVDIPHNAMLASLTGDTRERSELAAWRFAFSAVGSIAVSFLAAHFLLPGGGIRALQFPIAVAILYLVVMGAAAWSAPIRQRMPVLGDVGGAVVRLARNRPFLLLLGVCAAASAFTPLFAKMTVHYANSWLGDPTHAMPLLLAYSLAQILAQPVWTLAANRGQKRTAAIAAHGLSAAFALAFAVFSPTSLVAALPFFVAAGAATGGVYMINWAIFPDTIEHRDEAFSTGVFLLVLKITSGLGMGFAAGVLSIIDYDPVEASGARLSGIIMVMGLGPLLGAVAAVAVLAPLRLRHVAPVREESAFSAPPGHG